MNEFILLENKGGKDKTNQLHIWSLLFEKSNYVYGTSQTPDYVLTWI